MLKILFTLTDNYLLILRQKLTTQLISINAKRIKHSKIHKK